MKKVRLGTQRIRALALEALKASGVGSGKPNGTNYVVAVGLTLHAAGAIVELMNERAKTAEQMGYMLFNIEQSKATAIRMFDALAETARAKKAMLED